MLRRGAVPLVLGGLLAGACAAEPKPALRVSVEEAPAQQDTLLLSDPDEYRLDQPSRAAGENIFTRTGLGDPYRTGIPYPMFLALLSAYPHELGGDFQGLARRFGFLERAADPQSSDPDLRAGLPLGMHLTEDPFTGVELVVTNCTLCHAERLRVGGSEQVVVGLGNRRIRIHAYDAALSRLGLRSELSAERLNDLATASAIANRAAWSPRYGLAFATATLRALRERAIARERFFARVADGPPGLVATVESFALAMGRELGREVPTGARVGWSKIPDVVGYPARSSLSWDAAAIGSKDALVVEADFAAGARLEWFWRHPFQGPSLSHYLSQLNRALTFPGPIDAAQAKRGQQSFEVHCARCHGRYAEDGHSVSYEERVIPATVLGTDSARADAISEAYVDAANDPRMTRGLVQVRRSGGYVPPILTDVWARAPYGHAGQWPTLSVLAESPEGRPTHFIMDLSGALDLEHVGVPLRGVGAPMADYESLYDSSQPGRDVGGHPFLARLPDQEKRAVLEYLKTL